MTVSIKFSDFIKEYSADIAKQLKEKEINVNDLYAVIDYTLGEALWVVHFDTYRSCLEYYRGKIVHEAWEEDWLCVMSYCELQAFIDNVYVLMKI